MALICVNGDFVDSNQPLIKADNQAYRYGFGIFETIRVEDSTIAQADLHFERLSRGLAILKINCDIKADRFKELIVKGCVMNDCQTLARVRFSVSGGHGGIYEKSSPQFIIEYSPLELKDNEIELGICDSVRKSVDVYSNLKSSNFLPYIISAREARMNKWDEAVVLNNSERIADTTTANIFLVFDKLIVTPPLNEGPVAGTRRQLLLNSGTQLNSGGFSIIEKNLDIDDLEKADAVFLTNAIRGITRVKKFQKKIYNSSLVDQVKSLVIQTNKF